MTDIDLFTVTYQEDGSPDVTVEVFHIAERAVARRDQLKEAGFFAVIQEHGLAVGRPAVVA